MAGATAAWAADGAPGIPSDYLPDFNPRGRPQPEPVEQTPEDMIAAMRRMQAKGSQ